MTPETKAVLEEFGRGHLYYQDTMERMAKEIVKLRDKIDYLYGDLIGQEHRLGTLREVAEFKLDKIKSITSKIDPKCLHSFASIRAIEELIELMGANGS